MFSCTNRCKVTCMFSCTNRCKVTCMFSCTCTNRCKLHVCLAVHVPIDVSSGGVARGGRGAIAPPAALKTGAPKYS